MTTQLDLRSRKCQVAIRLLRPSHWKKTRAACTGLSALDTCPWLQTSTTDIYRCVPLLASITSLCRTMNVCLLCSDNVTSPPRCCDDLAIGSCDACVALAEIDSRIQETKTRLTEMLERRYEILTKLNECHDPISRYLPLELASKIFVQSLPTIPPPINLASERQDVHRDLPRQRVHLTHLCKAWRKIALSTPQLWQTVFADVPANLQDIKMTLRRSKNLPLTIDLRLETFWSSDKQRRAAMELICRHANCWRVLCIRAPFEVLDDFSEYASALTGPLPLLSAVIIRATKRSRRRLTPISTFRIGAPNIFSPAPTEVALFDIVVSKDIFDFSRLTTIVLEFVCIGNYIEILRRAPLLSSVAAKFVSRWSSKVEPDQRTAAPQDRFTHSALCSFKATIFDTNDESLFNSITFPNLKILECVATHVRHPEREYTDLQKFLCRSRCALERFDIRLACSEQELIDLLYLVSNVKHLIIDKCALTPRFFYFLRETSDLSESNEPGFLPILRSLRFQANQLSTDSFDWSLLSVIAPTIPAKPHSRSISKITVGLERHDSQSLFMTEKQEEIVFNLIERGVEICVLQGCSNEEASPNQLMYIGRFREALEKLQRETIIL